MLVDGGDSAEDARGGVRGYFGMGDVTGLGGRVEEEMEGGLKRVRRGWTGTWPRWSVEGCSQGR